MGRVSKFKTEVAKTPLGRAFESTWEDVKRTSVVGSLASGALCAMHELMRRRPATGGAAAVTWLSDVRSLAASIAAVGLWPFLLSPPYQTSLARLLDALPWPTLDWRERAYVLFLDGVTPDDHNAIEAIRYARHYPFPILAAPHRNSVDDPLELLRRFPLPDSAQPAVASDLKHRASLYHLLSTFIATPQAVLSANNHVGVAIDLVLFAATSIVASSGSISAYTHHIWLPLEPVQFTETQLNAVQLVGEQALAWLTEHLPVLGFASGLEEHIAEAKSIRYARRESVRS